MKTTRESILAEFAGITDADEVRECVKIGIEDIIEYLDPTDNPYPPGSLLAKTWRSAVEYQAERLAESIFRTSQYEAQCEREGPSRY